jgi:ribonuclease E
MFNPTVQLKSGGYIVIGVTEALVAIDVNSGRATREGSIEQTALNTNLEAAEEIARQLRLRDLAGLIVIDFIDMEERKNNAAVEKRLKDKLKTDRARIQVGRISGFGLLEMSRQRLRPGMLESTTQPCAHCHGTGLIRSDDSMALQVLRQLEEEGTRRRSREVLLRAPVAVVNYLMNQKREHIALIEARYDMAVRIEADPSLISPDYSIEKFKTATRVISPAMASVISAESTIMPDLEEEELFPGEDGEDAAEDDAAEEVAEESAAEPRGGSRAEAASGDGAPGKKKRRRRRRRRAGSANGEGSSGDTAQDQGGEADENGLESVAEAAPEAPAKKPGRTRTRTRKTAPAESPEAGVAADPVPDAVTGPVAGPQDAEARPDAGAGAAAKKPARSRRKAKDTEPAETPAALAEPVALAEAVSLAVAETPVKRSRARAKTAAAAVADADAPAGAEPPAALVAAPEAMVAVPAPGAPQTWVAAPEPVVENAPAEDEGKPKKRGWWSLGR